MSCDFNLPGNLLVILQHLLNLTQSRLTATQLRYQVIDNKLFVKFRFLNSNFMHLSVSLIGGQFYDCISDVRKRMKRSKELVTAIVLCWPNDLVSSSEFFLF